MLVIDSSCLERELDEAERLVADELHIMLAYICAVPPRKMWIDGKMPVLPGGVSREKVLQLLAGSPGHIAKIENEFMRATYRKLTEYVMKRTKSFRVQCRLELRCGHRWNANLHQVLGAIRGQFGQFRSFCRSYQGLVVNARFEAAVFLKNALQ